MKKLVLAAALIAAASTAMAGSLAEPVVEAPVIVEAAEGSSSGSFGGRQSFTWNNIVRVQ